MNTSRKQTTTCWVLASVNGKRKEKISKVRELLWRENEKSFAKCKWKVISYKFAGNGNIPKSCYSFRKVVTFKKVVIFLTDTIFRKVVIFFKRHNFLDKKGLNWFHWTYMFLAENGYKRKSIFDFSNTENFSFSAFIFLSNKNQSVGRLSLCDLLLFLSSLKLKKFEVPLFSLTGLIRFILGEINP